MANKYPFSTTEELKKHVSGVDVGFEQENIESGKRRAASLVKDIVSVEVWDLMINHFNSDNYNAADQQDENYQRLDELVEYFQFPMANFTFFFHFVWLQLRIGNDKITLTDKENSPYKYQEDEAKDQLLETAYEGINDLIDYLTTTATKWTVWAAETEYKTDDVVKNDGIYYVAVADHTSSAAFADDSANWTAKPESEIIFKEWTNSNQYQAYQNNLFTDYREFDQYISINRSAAFFVKVRTILNEVIVDNIEPRTGAIDTKVKADEKLLNRIKRHVAYQVMAVAVLRLDYFLLPGSLRKNIDSEYTRKSLTEAKNVRESLSAALEKKATAYMHDIDLYLAQKNKTNDDKPYNTFKSSVTGDDKFSSIGI